MADIYLEEMPARLAAARAALDLGDAPAFALAAHSMRSSSAQLGALTLAGECEAAENAVERGDFESAAARFGEVEIEFAAFRARLEGYAGLDRQAEDRPAASRDGPTIAVVEDNEDNRLLVDALLGDLFVLHEYGTGAEALDTMRRRVPDLVLLDVSLPGMDGLEVLSRMRADATLRAVPVIALTAHAMAGDRERYLAAGFDDYVPKPIEDEAVLLRAIERLLARTPRPAGDASSDARPRR